MSKGQMNLKDLVAQYEYPYLRFHVREAYNKSKSIIEAWRGYRVVRSSTINYEIQHGLDYNRPWDLPYVVDRAMRELVTAWALSWLKKGE